ncbi:hypothetical protein CAPTEDRAFT_191109 [Capitella teleta]|uniref:IPT/TIG domain-containing protein n=1 Tax=Capitella teleta TaxID=283909 RepID=R7UR72_CAPTE|nr:hypothetical protein CAPTEDRAFT_191109 [Capitella teleta]|eukprot:ELU08593.1 hypothetical protein CAPTEDRAFT_191109 [Capitella teleta]
MAGSGVWILTLLLLTVFHSQVDTSGNIPDGENIAFDASIGGTSNPIVMAFNKWTGGVKIHINVNNEDSDYDEDYADYMSTMYKGEPTQSETVLVAAGRSSGGTTLSVEGTNFTTESQPQMNITQLPITVNSSDGSKTFDKIEYPQTIAWGKFQHEVMVNVGGHSSNISQRYVNRIKFLPPGDDVIVLDQNAGCAPESFSVEVQAGNTNRHVGCLTYVDSKGQHLTIILMMVASVFVTLVIISVIACCVIRKGKKNSYTPNMELDTIGEKC